MNSPGAPNQPAPTNTTTAPPGQPGHSPGPAIAVAPSQSSLLRSLLDAIPQPVFIKDAQGRFVYVNRAMASRHHSPPETMVGKTDYHFFGPTVAAEKAGEEQAIRDSGRAMLGKVERESRPGQPERWTSTNKLPIRDAAGAVTGIMGVVSDITERRQTEQRLLEQAVVLDRTPEAILLVDGDHRIRFWSRGAERMYGWNAAEVSGKPVEEVLARGVVSPQFRQALQTLREHREWTGELGAITKSGKPVVVLSRCSLIHDDVSGADTILAINTDITERKSLEVQMLRAQRLEGIGRLAGGIAHDLNNVLAPLLIAVQLLKEKVNNADAQTLLESLDANVQRGAQLLKQILLYGRGSSGEYRKFQLGKVVQEVQLIVQETFPKSIVFETQSPANLWLINGDPTQLHQVLLNLCLNARDAMPSGGRLVIEVTNVTLDTIHVQSQPGARTGPYVVVKVIDTGMGIPREIQDKIFTPFFTTKPRGRGTGLGLSTCCGIVKNHGGFINFSSKHGEGTTFMVYLPAEPICAAATPRERPPVPPKGQNELVLVVDDEEPIRQVTKAILEDQGYGVTTATNGAEAVALYSQYRSEIAAVFIDMAMPVMDGPTAIAALMSVNPKIKIVGTSGFDTSDIKTKALNAGAQYFISKPYSFELLTQTLHDLLHPGEYRPAGVPQEKPSLV